MDEVASRLEGVSLEDDYPHPLICSHPIEGVSLEADCRARAGTKDWRWLLWESDVARAKLHPDLGPAWTAVLKEACCVRAGVDKDVIQRLQGNEGESERLVLRWNLGKLPEPDHINDPTFEWPKKKLLTASLLRWCFARGKRMSAHVVAAVALGGDLDTIKWIEKEKPQCRGKVIWSEGATFGAAMGGNLGVLKYIRERGCAWNPGTCYAAALRGHLDVLKYAHEHGCPWDHCTCMAAANGGHLDVLKYAREHGCPWDELTCSHAAYGGHLHVLKYARDSGCAWDAYTCMAAANGGHLDVLKYARECGCPWDAKTCEAGALHGQLETVKYAHENGCPWDKLTFQYAAEVRSSNEKREVTEEKRELTRVPRTHCERIAVGQRGSALVPARAGLPMERGRVRQVNISFIPLPIVCIR